MPNNVSSVVDLQRAVNENLLVERLFQVRAAELVENDDRTIEVIFSTEHEYTQWFGRERLSHETGAVDMSRMENAIAPVLLNHSRNDQIGVVQTARVSNQRGIATLRFSRNQMPDEIYRDILDGIRSQISCGYRILKWEVDETDPANPLYTITEWQPYEVSVVTVNADPNALVQRSDYFTPNEAEQSIIDKYPAGEPVDNQRGAEMPQPTDVTNEERIEEGQEATRSADPYAVGFQIYERGKAENEETLAMKIINERGSLEDFENALREKRAEMATEAANAETDAEREASVEKRFNLSDLVFQVVNAGAERGREALEEARDLTADAERAGYVRQSGGLIIPHSRLDGAERDLTSADSSGGHLIGTDVRGDLFVEALRNHMVVGDLVNTIAGLRGNVQIPKETTAPTAAWKGENVANTESDPVIGQLDMTPHFVRGFTEVSRTLIAQSSVDVEMFVRNALMKGVALVIDKAILSGTNAGDQPAGIDSITGLSTTEYGATSDTLAVALAKATVDNLITVEEALDVASAPQENRAWVVAPNVRAHYRAKPIGTGGVPAWYQGRLLDERAYVTNQVKSGDAYFGAWSECYLGLWDAVEVLINPYSGDTQGLVRITAWQMADIQFAHGASFAKLTKNT